MSEATEPRTLNPMQFFKDIGETKGVTADYRPRVAPDDTPDPQPEPDAERHLSVVTDHGEPARPADPADPDADIDGDDDPSEFDAILTPPEPEQESKSLDAPVLE